VQCTMWEAVPMSWCEQCDRYLTPSSLERDGTCPNCDSGEVLVDLTPPPRAPWHFKLLVAMAAVYLGWRAVLGIIWFVGWLG